MSTIDRIYTFCEREDRANPKTTEYDKPTALDEDVNQQFQLRLIELFTKYDIPFDADTFLNDDGEYKWAYTRDMLTYVETLLAQSDRVANSPDDMCHFVMRDAMRDIRQLMNLTTRRKEALEEYRSWEIDKLERAMAHGPQGLPSTERTFETFEGLSEVLEGDVAKEYDLSDAAAKIYDLFANGTTKQRRAILFMIQAARYVEQGLPIPNHHKQKLKRARKDLELCGWKLDTQLLR